MKAVIRGSGANTKYFVDGREVTRAEFDRLCPPAARDVAGPSSFSGVKPIVSDALAVHPNQVPEAIASAKRRGVPTEFLPDGRPVLTSRRHMQEYCRAYGFFNKGEIYSPRNR